MSDTRNDFEYSEKIAGDSGNYGWAVRADDTREGYLGITQHDEHGKVGERVLLSPDQVEAVIRFYRQWHPAKRAARV
ncbi:MAG TPA: hypothetical protein VEB59_05710 [Gemmatimonadales bacterium]|nr:hypothetical protein [Gemmatimonadales bacterium]